MPPWCATVGCHNSIPAGKQLVQGFSCEDTAFARSAFAPPSNQQLKTVVSCIVPVNACPRPGWPESAPELAMPTPPARPGLTQVDNGPPPSFGARRNFQMRRFFWNMVDALNVLREVQENSDNHKATSQKLRSAFTYWIHQENHNPPLPIALPTATSLEQLPGLDYPSCKKKKINKNCDTAISSKMTKPGNLPPKRLPNNHTDARNPGSTLVSSPPPKHYHRKPMKISWIHSSQRFF
jgi:hypothetical protein